MTDHGPRTCPDHAGQPLGLCQHCRWESQRTDQQAGSARLRQAIAEAKANAQAMKGTTP